MLKQAKFLNALICIGNAAKFLTGSNFQWDVNKKALRINQSVFTKCLLVSSLLGGIQLANFALKICYRKDSQKANNLTMEIFILAIYALLISYCYAMTHYGIYFQRFICLAYEFEELHSQELGKLLKEKSFKRIVAVSRLFIFLVQYPSMKTCPALLSISAFLLTSSPMNFFSLQPLNLIINGVMMATSAVFPALTTGLTWFIEGMVNWAIWTFSCKVAAVLDIQIVLGATALVAYASMIERNWRPHFEQDQANQSKMRIKTLHSVKVYKQLQILLKMFNVLHSGILVSLLVTLLTLEVVAAVKVIRSLSGGTFTSSSGIWVNGFLLQIVMYSVVAVVAIYGMAGRVNDVAQRCLRAMKNGALQSGKDRKSLIKIVNSLSVLKVEFASSNFVEKLTPYIFLEFTLARIIDCLLLSKR
ncbi:unnamed protein product [Orchesella dallaii]|uniref:Gustatory receptor n=1 Tax=Orchesella dallaii TaxID=48710 RepID=A0ABP1S6Z8_9HEXA